MENSQPLITCLLLPVSSLGPYRTHQVMYFLEMPQYMAHLSFAMEVTSAGIHSIEGMGHISFSIKFLSIRKLLCPALSLA